MMPDRKSDDFRENVRQGATIQIIQLVDVHLRRCTRNSFRIIYESKGSVREGDREGENCDSGFSKGPDCDTTSRSTGTRGSRRSSWSSY
jgi:hypothetical protein